MTSELPVTEEKPRVTDTPESKPETFCLVCFVVIIPPGLETHYPACSQRLLHTWWSPRCSSEDREEKQWVINILDHREQRETVRDGFNLQSNTADLWGRLPLVLKVLTKLNKEIPKLLINVKRLHDHAHKQDGPYKSKRDEEHLCLCLASVPQRKFFKKSRTLNNSVRAQVFTLSWRKRTMLCGPTSRAFSR